MQNQSDKPAPFTFEAAGAAYDLALSICKVGVKGGNPAAAA